jgi:glucose-1-phosphate thymidylyltransferase
MLRVPGPRLAEATGEKGTEDRRPVVEFLLRALSEAGVGRAYIVLRTGKWDIPAHFGTSPPTLDMELAYLATEGTASIPATLDVAYPFVRDATVVTGFADSWFSPLDAVRRTVHQHREGTSAVTLTLFPSDRPDKTDMVELEDDEVVGFRVKPGPCELEYTFGAAVWSPPFTEFLHDHLRESSGAGPVPTPSQELQVSQVLDAALAAGLRIAALRSPRGHYIDVGTPEDLERVRGFGIGRVTR